MPSRHASEGQFVDHDEPEIVWDEEPQHEVHMMQSDLGVLEPETEEGEAEPAPRGGASAPSAPPPEDWQNRYRELEARHQQTHGESENLKRRIWELEQSLIGRSAPQAHAAPVATAEPEAPDPYEHPAEYVQWALERRDARNSQRRQEETAQRQKEQVEKFHRRVKAGERRLRKNGEGDEYKRLVESNAEFQHFLKVNPQAWAEVFHDPDPAEAALELARSRELMNPQTYQERLQTEANRIAEERIAAALGKREAAPGVRAPKGTIATLPANRPGAPRKKVNPEDMPNDEFDAFFEQQRRAGRA